MVKTIERGEMGGGGAAERQWEFRSRPGSAGFQRDPQLAFVYQRLDRGFIFFSTWNVDEIGIGPKTEGESRTASRLHSLTAVQHRGWAMQSLPFSASSYPARTKFDRTRSAEPLADMAVDGERYPRASMTASKQVLNVPIYGQRTRMFLLISADNHDGNRVAEDMATRRAKAGTASTESGARPLDL